MKQRQVADNAVWLDEQDIIHILMRGPQTQASAEANSQKVQDLITDQRQAGKRVIILADLQAVNRTDSGARLHAKEFLQSDYDALAVVGNKYLQPLIFFVLRSTTTKGVVRYFNAKTAATKWLLDPTATTSKAHHGRPGHVGSLLNWFFIPLALLVLIATVASWQQSKSRLDARAQDLFASELNKTTQAVNDRLRAYTDALYGFRGLFHSSDYVNEKEFRDYFNSLNLGSNYPGFNAITYVSRVPQGQEAEFVARVRADHSLNPSGRNFRVTINKQLAEHFIVTYSTADTSTTTEGIDLANSDERRATLTAARDSGQPKATSSINLFTAEGKEGEQQGFLLTLPTYHTSVPTSEADRKSQHVGFVNAVFDYPTLLNDTLGGTLPETMVLRITDTTGTTLYERGVFEPTMQTATSNIAVGGRLWTLQFGAPINFGITRGEAAIPGLVLVLGIFISGFLTIIFWIQNRSRTRALQIAETMTEDLQTERNYAVATKNKDEALLSSIGDGVFALDRQNRITLFNKAAEVITGFTAKEVIGKPYSAVLLFRDEKGAEVKNDFIVQAQHGEIAAMARHTVVRRKDQQWLPVADSAAPIFDAGGKQEGVIVVFRDITKEQEFERALEASNERFELASKATSDAVYDLDIATGRMLWNEAFYIHYNYPRAKEINSIEWWTGHIHPDDALRVEREMQRALQGRVKTSIQEYRLRKADGKYAFVRDRLFIQRNESGEPVRLIGSLLDITKQKELDQAKDEFISLVSHQLRTPLTAIRLFTEMLMTGQVGALKKEQQDYLEKVDISTKRMIQLVGDILNVSRIELGRLKIQPVATDVNQLINSHLDEVKPLAANKGVIITFKPVTLPSLIMVDQLLLGQIIHNLMTNAIRYSRSQNGKVAIHFTKEKAGYVLSVRDNGIGIPDAAQAHIFQRFYRAENAVKVEGEGTGLGLYLVKLIIEISGGNIWFESVEGKGTAFYVKIPLSGMKAKQGDKSLN